MDQIEIILVDGMSTDGTREIGKRYQELYNNIRLIDNPGKIVPTGMNEALRLAKGNLIIRVDGHCVVEPDYVANCERHIQEHGLEGVGGPMRTVGEDLISEVIALAMSSKFGVGNSSFRTESGLTKLADTVPFPAYTREIMQRVGLYDEELVRNQDDEYNYRIREAGGRILLAEDVRSTYYSRGTYGKLWKQYFQYGYWKVRVMQKHPLQMSLRQFVPPIFVLTICLALVASLVFPWGWILLAALIGAYGIAALIASGMIAKSNGWHLLGLIPLAFVIIHVSYGSGFLIGMVKFWNCWGDKVGKVPEW